MMMVILGVFYFTIILSIVKYGNCMKHGQSNSSYSNKMIAKLKGVDGKMSGAKFRKTGFLILNGSKSVFPDRYTMETLGFSWDHVPSVDWDTINSYPNLNPQLKTLWDHHQNEQFIEMGNSTFISSPRKVFPSLLNPCFLFWNGDIVVSWRKDPSTIRVIFIKVQEQYSTVGSKIAHYMDYFLGYSHFYNDKYPHLEFSGEDPRLYTMGEYNSSSKQRLWVAYCQRHRRSRPELWMSYAELLLENENELKQDYIINFNFKMESQSDQKNWSPFTLMDTEEQLWIYGVNPHRIVKQVLTKFKNHVFGETVHSTKYGNVRNISDIWNWGELRGGTPAVLIDRKFYLAFFHSSNDPPRTGDVLRTYVFGAYTFCIKPPYRVLKISPLPITHESMFKGPWTDLPLSYYHIDYVAFPMSFIIDGNDIHLTYGKQDVDGWMMKIDMASMLDSLVTVNDYC